MQVELAQGAGGAAADGPAAALTGSTKRTIEISEDDAFWQQNGHQEFGIVAGSIEDHVRTPSPAPGLMNTSVLRCFIALRQQQQQWLPDCLLCLERTQHALVHSVFHLTFPVRTTATIACTGS